MPAVPTPPSSKTCAPDRLRSVPPARIPTIYVRAESLESHARELSAVSDERERVARDLHLTVIPRLFATGLSLMSSASRTSEPGLADRLLAAVDEIDEAIRQLRIAMFATGGNVLPTTSMLGFVTQCSGE